jgi:hypothetical protein
MKLTDRQLRNFWKKVNKIPGGCWEWTGFKDRDGYGQFRFAGRPHPSHRISFLIHSWYLPTGLVLHTCDNPKCVNPQHLKEGTHMDNMRDMNKRGRRKNSKGRKPGNKAAMIKAKEELAAGGARIRELARKYKVTPATIRYYRSKLKTQ